MQVMFRYRFLYTSKLAQRATGRLEILHFDVIGGCSLAINQSNGSFSYVGIYNYVL